MLQCFANLILLLCAYSLKKCWDHYIESKMEDRTATARELFKSRGYTVGLNIKMTVCSNLWENLFDCFYVTLLKSNCKRKSYDKS